MWNNSLLSLIYMHHEDIFHVCEGSECAKWQPCYPGTVTELLGFGFLPVLFLVKTKYKLFENDIDDLA